MAMKWTDQKITQKMTEYQAFIRQTDGSELWSDEFLKKMEAMHADLTEMSIEGNHAAIDAINQMRSVTASIIERIFLTRTSA